MRCLVLMALLVPVAARADVTDGAEGATGSDELRRGVAGLTAGIRAHDPRVIATYLRPTFTNGGVWFADRQCAKAFPGASEITGRELQVFARCLATLELQLSTRQAAAPNGAVLTAQPGIEIEVAFDDGRVSWIGHSLRARAVAAVPMLTAQAFEALRTHGTSRLVQISALDALVPDGHAPVSAWIEICLDARGAKTTVSHHRATSASAGEAFARVADGWAFRPFVVGGTAVAACSLSLLTYPTTAAPAIEVLPPVTGLPAADPGAGPSSPLPAPQMVVSSTLERLRLTGTRDIEPDAVTRAQMIDAGKLSVLASAKICVDVKGRVHAATLQKTSGFEAFDRKLLRELAAWSFKPYRVGKKAVEVCTGVSFLVVPDPTMLNP